MQSHSLISQLAQPAPLDTEAHALASASLRPNASPHSPELPPSLPPPLLPPSPLRPPLVREFLPSPCEAFVDWTEGVEYIARWYAPGEDVEVNEGAGSLCQQEVGACNRGRRQVKRCDDSGEREHSDTGAVESGDKFGEGLRLSDACRHGDSGDGSDGESVLLFWTGEQDSAAPTPPQPEAIASNSAPPAPQFAPPSSHSSAPSGPLSRILPHVQTLYRPTLYSPIAHPSSQPPSYLSIRRTDPWPPALLPSHPSTPHSSNTDHNREDAIW